MECEDFFTQDLPNSHSPSRQSVSCAIASRNRGTVGRTPRSPVGGAQLRGAGDDELGALQWPYSDREHRIELENMQ